MHIKKERRCVACHNNFLQDEMLRICKMEDKVFIDLNQKAGGRGAYVCKNKQCLGLAIKKKLFNRSFKENLNQSIYEKLGEYEKNN